MAAFALANQIRIGRCAFPALRSSRRAAGVIGRGTSLSVLFARRGGDLLDGVRHALPNALEAGRMWMRRPVDRGERTIFAGFRELKPTENRTSFQLCGNSFEMNELGRSEMGMD